MSGCLYCGEEVKRKRSDAKYCSARCRSTAEKQRYKERMGQKVVTRGPNNGRSYDKDYTRRRTSAANKEWRARNGREYHLKKTYGIDLDQYNQLLEQQEHRCAICLKHEDECKKRLAVDHNHKTGEIRGLLCNHCNHRVVGRHTDGDVLRKIADYVEQGTGWIVPPRQRKTRRKKKVQMDSEVS